MRKKLFVFLFLTIACSMLIGCETTNNKIDDYSISILDGEDEILSKLLFVNTQNSGKIFGETYKSNPYINNSGLIFKSVFIQNLFYLELTESTVNNFFEFINTKLSDAKGKVLGQYIPMTNLLKFWNDNADQFSVDYKRIEQKIKSTYIPDKKFAVLENTRGYYFVIQTKDSIEELNEIKVSVVYKYNDEMMTKDIFIEDFANKHNPQ